MTTQPEMLMEALGNTNADLVISDMAAPTIGHRRTDHMRTMALVEVALDFCVAGFKTGRAFSVENVPGWNRANSIEPDEEELRISSSCEAASQPRWFG